MPRAKRGTKLKRRHKKLLKLAKGVIGGRKNYRQARSTVEKALVYAYRDRRVRKRNLRSLWIVRINAAARLNGITYRSLIFGLKKAGVEVDRKMLADLAVNDTAAFGAIAEQAKAALAKAA